MVLGGPLRALNRSNRSDTDHQNSNDPYLPQIQILPLFPKTDHLWIQIIEQGPFNDLFKNGSLAKTSHFDILATFQRIRSVILICFGPQGARSVSAADRDHLNFDDLYPQMICLRPESHDLYLYRSCDLYLF